MKKQKNSSKQVTNPKQLLDKEQKRIEVNQKLNRPILVVTYGFAFVILAMIGYIIYFMAVDARDVIANSANKRQDNFASKVIRGDIQTSDGKIIAKTQIDKNGTETRQYPYDNLFSHVVGYTQYGKSGLELEGNYYMLTSTANIFERVYKTLKEEKNMGDTLVSTLRYDVQKAAYRAMKNAQGAVMVMEPSTGKVLAMVSKPDFDANEMEAVWERATAEGSTESMLVNRATQGLYAPGSTFKVLTVLEYMREHADYDAYTYTCEGEGIFHSVAIHCAGGKAHGKLTLAGTLAQSCNTSIANIGMSLRLGSFQKLLSDFLFNQDLPYKGIYNKSTFALTDQSEKNQIPQTVIGQGQTQITPLHNLLIISTIANGGIMMRPYLIDSVENYQGARVKKFTASSYGRIISGEEAMALSSMLSGVVEDGTATKYLGGTNYSVAGKTGTAEYGTDGNVNSWFIGYSNVENPDIAVSIVIEDADTVGIKAAQVARAVFDAYYQSK